MMQQKVKKYKFPSDLHIGSHRSICRYKVIQVSNFLKASKMITKRIAFFCTFAVVTLASPLPSSEASTNTSTDHLKSITTGLHILNNVTVSELIFSMNTILAPY